MFIGPKIDSIYKTILNDAGVRAVVDKITRHFPSAPFVAIVVGTGAASEPATFVLFPLLELIPGVAVAGSLASLVKSAVNGKPVPPGIVFTLLKSVGAAGLGVPPLVVGTMMGGTVRAVKLLQGKAGGGGVSSKQAAVGAEGRSVGDDAGVREGESSGLVAEGAQTGIEGDELGQANDSLPSERVPNVVEDLVSRVSDGVAGAGEVLDSTWTVAKTVAFEKYLHRPKPKL
ncbi:hypothetical protein FRC10_011310 [Ceratobasidium sp. 414]|nr:hypothetical protein FRC10_011310 [Ceratobasidium sp. 414]